MHHDAAVLEQVCYHTFKPQNFLFLFQMLPLPPYYKAFGNNAHNSDQEEKVESETESEQEQPDVEPDNSKEDKPAGKYIFPLVRLNIFINIP